MKYKLLSALAISGAALLSSQAALASDGRIDFSGAITAQTCSINGGAGEQNFAVVLPTLSVDSLGSPGATAGRTPFSINLTGCQPGTVRALFESGTTTDASGNLKLEASSTADNVQIGLLNSDLSAIKAGFAAASQNSQSVAIASGSATLSYFAEYVAGPAAVVPGTVKSSVVYSLSYE